MAKTFKLLTPKELDELPDMVADDLLTHPMMAEEFGCYLGHIVAETFREHSVEDGLWESIGIILGIMGRSAKIFGHDRTEKFARELDKVINNYFEELRRIRRN